MTLSVVIVTPGNSLTVVPSALRDRWSNSLLSRALNDPLDRSHRHLTPEVSVFIHQDRRNIVNVTVGHVFKSLPDMTKTSPQAGGYRVHFPLFCGGTKPHTRRARHWISHIQHPHVILTRDNRFGNPCDMHIRRQNNLRRSPKSSIPENSVVVVTVQPLVL